MNENAIASQGVPQVLVDSVCEGVLDTFPIFFGPLDSCGEDKVNGAGSEGFIGIISFVGTLPWTLIMAIPQTTATSVAGKFAGFEIPFESPDMLDAIGELVNILAGTVSAKAEAASIKSKMSLPSVTRGPLQVLLPDDAPIHRLHFTSAQGPFRVKIITAPAVSA